MFLCRTVAHDLNYERALEGITPEMFARWQALYRLEPWGDDWVQTARLEAAIANSTSSGRVEPADLIPNEDNRRDDFLDDAALANNWKARCGWR